jgi:hypothetical protein
MRLIGLISLCFVVGRWSAMPAALPAQEESSAGIAALDIPTGARPLGMGRAFVASSGDIQGLFYNPAGLAARDSIGVSFSRYEGASDLDLNGNFGAVSFPLLRGSATLAISYEDLGEFELTGSTADPLGTQDLSNVLFVGSYALRLGPRAAVGASLKYLRSDLGVADGNGVAFDAGALLRPSATFPLTLGVALLNLGPEITYKFEDAPAQGDEESTGDDLPSRIRWGMALDVGELTNPESDYGVQLAGDVEHDLRELGEVSLFGGAALDYRNLVTLRGGVLRLNNSFGEKSSVGASLGAGVRWQRFRIDLARELNVSEIGDETHFSLEVSL